MLPVLLVFDGVFDKNPGGVPITFKGRGPPRIVPGEIELNHVEVLSSVLRSKTHIVDLNIISHHLARGKDGHENKGEDFVHNREYLRFFDVIYESSRCAKRLNQQLVGIFL